MALTPDVDNILAVWHGAFPEHHREGAQWYADARALAETLDPSNPARAAAVIAVLSPLQAWPTNRRMAMAAYADRSHRGLTNSVSKANRILDGESPETVIGPASRKVMAFWRAIAGLDTLPVIDRHAHDIAVGKQCDDDERRMGKGRYVQFEQAYLYAAYLANVPAHVLQAVTWVAWRDACAISYA